MSEKSDFRAKSIFSLILIVGISALFLWGIITTLNDRNNGLTDIAETQESINNDIRDGKNSGRYCLSANEAWKNIGRKTCVAFYPQRYAYNKGHWFLDEKTNYKEGFVAYFAKKDMIGETDFKKKFFNGNVIAVYGEISSYQGHPQIKVYELNQVTKATKVNCKSNIYGCVYTR